MDVTRFKVNNFLEIKLSLQKEDKGLWKIIEAYKMNDGDEDFYRIKLDQNESKQGDEIWAEYYPSMPKKLCIFQEFQAFPKDKAQGWPPPDTITMEDIEYFTLDPEVSDNGHEGFKGFDEDGKEYYHWEYENEKGDKLIQVTLIDDYVTMYKGYTLNTGFVNLI